MSKRILHNESIYKQIAELEVEYFDKIDELLSKIPSNLELTEENRSVAIGYRRVISIQKEIISIHQYSDKYDRGSTSRLLCIKSCIELLSGFEELQSVYTEGMSKIKKLVNQYQEPKRIITFENFENLEECEKLYDYALDDYLKNPNKDSYNDMMVMLNTRSKLIGIKKKYKLMK